MNEQDAIRPNPRSRATASGKVILFGEHAVVYGRPAIAVPLADLRATACVTALPAASEVVIDARDLHAEYVLSNPSVPSEGAALQTTVCNALRALGADKTRLGLRISVSSQIPIARGMGSGTAVATAMVRALASHFERRLSSGEVSALVYETEKLLHGTPSGVDNTVVAYEHPIYYVPGQAPEPLSAGDTLYLLIGDTGVPSQTRVAVLDVQQKWRSARSVYERLFDGVRDVVMAGREALAAGDDRNMGHLMDRNHALLRKMGVSDPALERLIDAAHDAGALGAKLSGGGRGGVMLALVSQPDAARVTQALLAAGAMQVYATRLLPT